MSAEAAKIEKKAEKSVVKHGKKVKRFPVVSLIIVILGSIGVLVPVYWMVITAFKPSTELFSIPPTIWPKNFTLQGFKNVIHLYDFPTYFLNSMIVVCGSTILTLVVSTLAGYAASRYNFKGKGAFLGFVLVTQMFPSVIMLIPYFRILRMYHLINTYLGLIIVYISFQTPLCTWLMYSYFKTIPKELDQAASIDGLNHWGIFWRINLPLAVPGLASTAIYSFINSWNEFQFALTLTSSERMKTVAVGIGEMLDDTNVFYSDMMAACILASIPLIIFFFFGQNLFFAGMTAGSVKE